MRMRLGLLAVLLALAISLAWSSGCRKDVFVDYPPSLIGDYEGTYAILLIDGIDTLIDTINFVTMRFTNTNYNMAVNKKLEPEDKRFFCSVEGAYTLDNGLQFEELNGNLFRDVCTEDYNPRSSFGLDQSSLGDTILILQDLTDSLGIRSIKTLKLRLVQ